MMVQALRSLLLGSLVLALTACGGGSSGGSSQGTFTLSQDSLSFNADEGGPIPPSQSFQLILTSSGAAYVGARWPNGDPGWADVQIAQGGNNNTFIVTVTMKTTSLAASTRSATLEVGTADSQHNVLNSEDVQLSYTLADTLEFTTSPITLSAINGAPSIQNLTVNVAGTTGKQWQITSNAAWLTVPSSTQAAGVTSFAASVDTTSLGLGTANGTITITNANNASEKATLSVSVNVTPPPPLAFVTQPISVTTAYGSAPVVNHYTVSVSGTQGKQWQITSNATWLTVPSGVQSAGAISFSATLDTTNLLIGNYTGTITITNTANALDTTTLSVGVTITNPTVAVGFTSAPPSVSSVWGNPSSQTLAINIIGVAYKHWQVTSNVSWLTVPTGTQGPGSASFNATMSPTGVAIGVHTGTITLTDTDDSADTATLLVTLNVAMPQFSATPNSILLGGSDGLSTAKQPLSFSINTGTNSYAWSVVLNTTDGASWLLADSTSGSVSATQQTINLSFNRTGLKGGVYTGSVLFSANVLGQIVQTTIPVTFNLEADNLFVSADGVAFSSFPSSSTLTRTLTVNSTTGLSTVPWAAVSDQSWLSVSSIGTTGGSLVLTADPAGLTADQEYIANVTITSADPTIENKQTVRVGLWVGSTNPAATTTSIGTGMISVVTDPVEPYAFVNSGGTDVSVYNVYTGALVTTYSSVAPALGPMGVSTDGATLYAVDLTNSRIVPVAVATGTVGGPYQLTETAQVGRGIVYVRPKAHPVLVYADGTIFDVKTQSIYSDQVRSGYSIAASADGLNIYTISTSVAYPNLQHDDIAFTALVSSGITETNANFNSPGGTCVDLAVSLDALHVYPACTVYPFIGAYDGTSLSETGVVTGAVPYGAWTVATSWNGTLAVGYNASSAQPWLYFYNNSGAGLGQFSVGTASEQLQAATAKISGDGTRVSAVTVDTSTHLKFFNVP